MEMPNFKLIETKINPRFKEILGTDRFEDCNETFDKEYYKYRKKWSENPKNFIVDKFPLHLDIETTNICNLRCIMCFQSDEKWRKRQKFGFMKWKLFKKIIDEGAKYNLPSIKLNYRGEPLLHPKIVDMVKYAKKKGILEVQFNTNGTLLNEEKINELIDAGLDRIIFSFDGATKETYEKIRIGSNYESVVNNIKTLVKLRNAKGLKRPCVRVQLVRQEENIKEVDDFIEMWKDIVNRIGIIEKRSKDGVKKYKEAFPCPQIWQRMIICWDGEVRMCCGDWNGEIILGDAKKHSLAKLWRSEEYLKIRELHKKGEFYKIPVCAKCEINKVK